jgi:hypothetical protein
MAHQIGNLRILGIGGLIAVMAALFVLLSPAALIDSKIPVLLEHPKVPNAATLTGPRAEAIYQAVRGQLRKGYLQAGDPIAEAYQSWRRFNQTPYRSPNHGERFVNHYGNAEATDYAKFENLSPLPDGAVIIKDSFAITRNGDLTIGPFFMMEKMPVGFPSLAGTWRFMMLRGDGTLVGVTDGYGTEKVRFCAECHHNAGAQHDYLFFMPRQARIKP